VCGVREQGFRMDMDRSISRRTLLRFLAGGTVALGLTPLLAACGGDDDDDNVEPTSASGAGTAAVDTATEESDADGNADPGPDEGSPEGDPGTEGDPEPENEVDPDAELVVYSGRSEELVGPIIERFEEETGVEVSVRYGDTAELAAQLLEEGSGTPAHVYFAQDAGALGAVAKEGMFAELPEDILTMVDERFRSPDGLWVGITGRARAVVYNTDELSEADIPESILGFTDEKWKGKLGWAPTNGSFQSFVTALRVIEGDDVARDWLEGIMDNDVRSFEGNNPIVTAVINGEIQAGFVNHYYLLRQQAEAGGDLPAENFIYKNGDPGALVNVAGIGILSGAADNANAREFIEFLLSEEGQTYFAEEEYEYPLAAGVPTDEALVPLEDIQTPDIDLSDLADLEGTLELLTDVGLL
jgi:iron(III) transport system substrate-binding protein